VDGDLAAVKLLDFGIAREGRVLAPTRSGAVMGTPGYVAPEQAQGSRGVGTRADVFALGAVLYECLTGQPAFRAGNVMALLAKILLEEAPRARELNPEVPVALDALVARLLAKDPALRPRDAAEVVEELRRIADRDAPTVPPAPTALTAGEQRVLSVIVATLAPVAKAPQAPTMGLDDSALSEGWDDPPPPAPDV